MYSAKCGILPDQEWNLCLLHWQADFLPLSHQKSPNYDLWQVSFYGFSLFGDALFFPQFSSVTQSCLTLCNPMNHSTPGLPVHHQLLEFTQTHVHRVSDAIQPSHPMSSPFPPASNPSEHQRLPMSQQTSDESTLHMRWPKYGSFSLAACFFSWKISIISLIAQKNSWTWEKKKPVWLTNLWNIFDIYLYTYIRCCILLFMCSEQFSPFSTEAHKYKTVPECIFLFSSPLYQQFIITRLVCF